MENKDQYHSGIEWPVLEDGKISTSVTNKAIWMEGLQKGLLDRYISSNNERTSRLPKHVQQASTLLTKMKGQARKDWRFGYVDLIHEYSIIMSQCNTEDTLNMAKAGLDALNSSMVVKTNSSGFVVSAKDAVLIDGTVPLIPLSTHTVQSSSSSSKEGGGEDKMYGMVCPRDEKVLLTGEKMISQLQTWVKYGCVEPSVCERAGAIAKLTSLSQLNNLKHKVFVLLGATSALGPARVLLDMANNDNDNDTTVMAIARPGTKLQSLIHQYQTKSSATLLVPQLVGNSMPGADLIQHAPELARWIVQTFQETKQEQQEKQLVILNLAYLDGEKNVRASVAMDLITEYVCQKETNTAVGYILSPSTSHVMSKEAAMDAKIRYESCPWWHRSFHYLSIAKQLKPSNVWLRTNNDNDNNNLIVYNGLVDTQGPNYALTKSSQQWRAMILAYSNHVVSANFGPPCRTDNMTSHSTIAIAIEGMQYIPPNVTFHPKVARTLLTALLLYDICIQHRTSTNTHPMTFFLDGAAHGGAWRSPYLGNSIGVFSYFMGKVSGGSWTPKESLASTNNNNNNQTNDDTLPDV